MPCYMLAFELTPEWAGVIGLLITTIGSILVALLQAKGKAREAAALTAVIHGVEKGVDSVAKGSAPLDAVKVSIKEVATDRGVQDYLHQRVEALYPTTPAQGTPTSEGQAS